MSHYKDAGVDIDAGHRLVNQIKTKIERHPAQLDEIGGFAGLFDLSQLQYQAPVLVSATDGVGTKLNIAVQMDKHDTIGQDLVAMCLNDLICVGAKPLYFLDYFSTGRLSVQTAEAVISGIASACATCDCALIGGETAEMPGMYRDADYDLAGFAVGVVEKHRMLRPGQTTPGDQIIGLASTGVHSNGYSLVRKILKDSKVKLETSFAGSTFGEVLLTPTRLYVEPILRLLASVKVHGLAHITGGGLIENVPRVMAPNQVAHIETNKISPHPIFNWLITRGKLSQQEAYRTFNCGVGMTVIVPQQAVEQTLAVFESAQVPAQLIGEIQSGSEHSAQVVLH